MKKLSFLFFFALGFMVNGQSQLNEYKYIIVPKKFNEFKKENQYLTSTLVKHNFNKKGFIAIYQDGLPDELIQNICLGLTVEILDSSSMFSTKTSLLLKDCKGQEVFVTKEGSSRLKEYKAAYSQSLAEAFQSFDGAHKFSGKTVEVEEPITVSFKNDVKKLEEQVVEKEAVKTAAVIKKEEPKTDMKNIDVEVAVVSPSEPIQVAETSDLLYAQKIPNGYQLVDSTPSIRFKMYKSTVANTYQAVGNGVSGMVHNKDGKWYFEYFKEGELIIEELQIKF
ncbi:MAG: hypothetical protein COA50_12605 [Flavobacteriaceae bacterium]|nr:MAG: hypothetical protein COA50_12605 [Flavobacteriaceae bacterium]